VLNNVLIIDLEQIRWLTAKESNVKCAVIVVKVAKCKQSSILTSIQYTQFIQIYQLPTEQRKQR
jgi:hypothetical protein